MKKLSSPPIVEAFLAIHFEPIPEIGPVQACDFWQRRRPAYPKAELKPEIGGPALEIMDLPRLRTWLISADESYVVQVQHDRFAYNWRSRGSDYPSSSTLLAKALEEYGQFRAFLAAEYLSALVPLHVEIGKLDHFVEGVHWTDADDLARLIPMIASSSRLVGGTDPACRRLESTSQHGDWEAKLVLQTATPKAGTLASKRVVRLDTNLTGPAGPEIIDQGTFQWCNEILNAMFERLIPMEELERRFNASE